MNPKKLVIILSLLGLFVFYNCSIKDEVDNTIQRAECAQLLADFTDLESENRTCAQIIADVDRIERECNEFLDEDTKTFLANARASCSGS